MEVLRISGGTCLKGDVQISGSKNAALPQFAATLLSNEKSILRNIPDLSDVRFMGEILSELGANVNRIDKTTWEIDPANIIHCAPYDLVMFISFRFHFNGYSLFVFFIFFVVPFPTVARFTHAKFLN